MKIFAHQRNGHAALISVDGDEVRIYRCATQPSGVDGDLDGEAVHAAIACARPFTGNVSENMKTALEGAISLYLRAERGRL